MSEGEGESENDAKSSVGGSADGEQAGAAAGSLAGAEAQTGPSEAADAETPEMDVSLHVGQRKVIHETRRLVKYLHKNLGLTNEDLAEAIRIPKGAVEGLLYAGKKKRWLSIEDLKKIVAFARRQANDKGTDPLVRSTLKEMANHPLMALRSYVELEGLTPTEYALVQNLGIDWSEQVEFSDAYAGVYAILRLTSDGRLAVSRMNVRPREKDGAVCRFTTLRAVRGLAQEPQVVGYIYTAAKKVFAIGRTIDAGVLRSTILSPVHGREWMPGDMWGVRISASDLDGGTTFAHRIFCRRIGAAADLGRDWADWDAVFDVHDDTDATRLTLGKVIADLPGILRLLAQAKEPPTPWGLALPRI